MTVLYITPESSALVHAAAAAILYLHIKGATFKQFCFCGKVAYGSPLWAGR
jgi:hypothetical protein